MTKILKTILLVLGFAMLVLVRAFAKDFFYDPFLLYFKNDYLHKAFPTYDMVKLLGNLFARYAINMLISLSIIYVFFKNKNKLKFALKFYLIAFVLLILLFFLVLKNNLFSSHLPLFYIRRFLIHPIFILLLIPAFYYQDSYVKS